MLIEWLWKHECFVNVKKLVHITNNFSNKNISFIVICFDFLATPDKLIF